MRCINCGAKLPQSDSDTVECEYCGCKQRNPLPADYDTVILYADETPVESYKAKHTEIETAEKLPYLEYGIMTPNERRKLNGLLPVEEDYEIVANKITEKHKHSIMDRIKAIRMPTNWQH